MALKIAMIGAGSVGFTRGLLRDILSVPELSDTQFAFHDLSDHNMDMVTQLCRRDIEANGLAATVTPTTDRRAALEGADYVLCMIRQGGLEAFQSDIDIPLKYGVDQCVGDTLCAGGLMYAQRTIPALLDFCRDIREVAKRSGHVIHRTPLPFSAFGEGIAVVDNRAYQLTWKGGHGVAYDLHSLAPIDSFSYEGEGWGLTAVGSLLYMSDGSSELRVVDPHGFREIKRVKVMEGASSVWMLNELELVGDELWANIYQTDLIARIVPSTGQVIGWIDLSGLLTPKERSDVMRRGGVANGIAFDASRQVVLVTGKLWPRVFELRLADIPGFRSSAR